MEIDSPWFVRRRQIAPSVRLFCFPYSGGQAGLYTPWQAALGEEVEVCGIQLPGRGARIRETPFRSLDAVVDAVAPLIAEEDDAPFAIFGHSMGALLAYEVTRRLIHVYDRVPARLFVSGCEAPRLRSPGTMHLLSDAALIDELRRLNGTPQAVLANRELLELFLPILRADFSIGGTYAYQAPAPLDVPITVLAGTSDPYTPYARVAPWLDESQRGGEVRWFDGDHFFIHSSQADVLTCIEAALA